MYHRFISIFLVGLLTSSILLATPQTVSAAYPGQNGRIAFVSDRDRDERYYDIYVTSGIPGDQVERLTTNTGETWDVHPAWSPNGRQLAFARYDGEDYEIFVINSDGSSMVQLTDNEMQDYQPAWSPDGLRIAYSSGSSLDDFTDWEIMVMNADGSEKNQLTDNNFRDVEPDWSPDGTKIVFESWALDPEGPADAEIFYMDADGSNIVQVTNNEIPDYEPQWHPDGSKLVYTQVSDNPQISVLDLDTLEINQLTSDSTKKYEPTWSPDGQKIAFQRQDDEGDYEIVIIDADGTGFVKLTENEDFDIHPAWQCQTLEMQLEEIQDTFDDAIENGDLEGAGPGNSASGRLNALRNMLEKAEELIDQGEISEAIHQLENVYKRVDGNPKPPDFAVGDDAEVIASMILELIEILRNL